MLFKDLENGDLFYRQGIYFIVIERNTVKLYNAICIKSNRSHYKPGSLCIFEEDAEVKKCTIQDVAEDRCSKVKFRDLKIGDRFTYCYYGECIKIKDTFEYLELRNLRVNALAIKDGVLHSIDNDELVKIVE